VLLLNCFWAYGYSHLRAADGPASRMTWSTPDDVDAAARAARIHELTIVCRDADHRPLELLLIQRGLPSLLVHPRWLVLGNGSN
jgi:hypothetical protein